MNVFFSILKPMEQILLQYQIYIVGVIYYQIML